jgi:hypothetical protein
VKTRIFEGPGRFWSEPSNWREGRLPEDGDIVVIDLEGASVADLPYLHLEAVEVRRGHLVGRITHPCRLGCAVEGAGLSLTMGAAGME